MPPPPPPPITLSIESSPNQLYCNVTALNHPTCRSTSPTCSWPHRLTGRWSCGVTRSVGLPLPPSSLFPASLSLAEFLRGWKMKGLAHKPYEACARKLSFLRHSCVTDEIVGIRRRRVLFQRLFWTIRTILNDFPTIGKFVQTNRHRKYAFLLCGHLEFESETNRRIQGQFS